MQSAGIIAAGEVPNGPAGKLDVHREVRPDCASRSLMHKRLHALDGTAKRTHDINRVWVERSNMEPGRAFVGIVDPQSHINEEYFTQLPLLQQLLGTICRWRKAMIEINPEQSPLLFREAYHLSCMLDSIRNRFLHQHMLACCQTLHGRLVVMTAVFDSSCRHTDCIN